VKCNNELGFHNVRAGQVVALEGDYSPMTIAAFLALIERSAIVVPITRVASARRKEFIEIAEVQSIISVDPDDHLTIEHMGTTVTNTVTIKLTEMERPGVVLFSSGSTGKPKAALHNVDRLLEKFKTVRTGLVTIAFLLLDHIGGINTLFHTLANGGSLVLLQDRDPETVCQAMEKHRVELLPTSPTFLNLLLVSGACDRYDLSSLKKITYGTEVMPETTLKRLHSIFPQVALQQTYGLSELGILRSKSKQFDSVWVKIGGQGVEVKVVDGILWLRSEFAMMGYLNAPSPMDDDGWMNTGDRVIVEGDQIRILGRESDVINVGGQKVYPAEVENVLMQMDNVEDVLVYGEKNPIIGNIVGAKINVRRPERLEELKKRMRAFCKDRLESFKIPIRVEIVTESQFSNRFKKMRERYQKE
jgi:acyl-CoA synthetase (AMP-forming)/AMP-acid ligase II